MSDLSDAIRAFMVKYPDHVELTWQRPARKPASAAQQALATAVGDLVTASERIRPAESTQEVQA